MNHHKLLLPLLLAACTEVIEVDPGAHTARLLIVAMFNNEPARQKVYITQSVAYFSGEESPNIKDAAITLNGGGIENLQFEWNDTFKSYLSVQPFSIKPNTTYRLRVTCNGTNYDAEDTSPDSTWVAYASLMKPDMQDTSKQRPMFLISGAVMRSNYHRDIHVRVSQLHNGKRMSEKISNMVVGEVPKGSSYDANPTLAPALSSVGTGWFTHEGRQDTQYYAPRDTIGLQMHTISPVMYRFVASVQQESGSSNPLFGASPANVEGNFSNNALGALGLYITGAPYNIHLPINHKSFEFDETYWVCHTSPTDSAVITIQDGKAIYLYPPAKRSHIYFENLTITPDKREFSANISTDIDGSQVPRRADFRIINYYEFHALPSTPPHLGSQTPAIWRLQRSYRREERITSILMIF